MAAKMHEEGRSYESTWVGKMSTIKISKYKNEKRKESCVPDNQTSQNKDEKRGAWYSMDCGEEILKKVDWKVLNHYGQSFKIRSQQNVAGGRQDQSEAKQR